MKNIISVRRHFKFIGLKISFLFFLSIFLGIILFYVELNFAKYFQLFLWKIGLFQKSELISNDSNGEYILLIFSFIALSRIILVSSKGYISQVANQVFLKEKRMRILSLVFLKIKNRNSSHEIVSFFSEKLTRAAGTVSDTSSLISTSIISFFIFIWGMINAPKEFLLALTFTVILISPLFFIDRKIRKIGGQIDSTWDFLNKSVIEGMRFYYFLFFHGLQYKELEKSADELESYKNNFLKFYLFSAIKNALPQIVGLVVVFSVTFISKKFFLTNSVILLSFLYLFIRFAQNGGEILYSVGCLRLSYSNFCRVLTFLEDDHDANDFFLEEAHIGTSIKKIDDTYLMNIDFAYPGKQKILDDFSLHLKRGTPLIIKGASGAGKSTLLSILLGLSEFERGHLIMKGEEGETHFDKRWYVSREELAYVGPESFFFEGSIEENLKYGNSSISEDEIVHMLELLGLKEVIFSRALGIKEMLSENSTFSTGQKQRLALARAFLRKPQLLILDEATANLDRETEVRVVSYLRENFNNTFLIIVTHKESFDYLKAQHLVLSNELAK